MASNRHLGRILALQSLYETDFRVSCDDDSTDLSEILDRNIKRYSKSVDDVAFIRSLASKVNTNSADLDKVIQPIAPDWPIDQIARMDRLVLRMSAYELLDGGDVPPKVVINEAVELSKAFGGENSSKFINGVLGTLLKRLQEGKLDLPKSLTFDKKVDKK